MTFAVVAIIAAFAITLFAMLAFEVFLLLVIAVNSFLHLLILFYMFHNSLSIRLARSVYKYDTNGKNRFEEPSALEPVCDILFNI